MYVCMYLCNCLDICTSSFFNITEISWPDATDMRFSLASFVQFKKCAQTKRIEETLFYVISICTSYWAIFKTYDKRLDFQRDLLNPEHRKQTMQKWAGSWDYGTYHIGDQRRLRRACASAQSRQSLRCSYTWSMELDEVSDQISDI